MAKYVKKPVIVDAFKWIGGPEQKEDPVWICEAIAQDIVKIEYPHVLIKTLEGTMKADVGDYIIRGVKGEIYPCKPDIFEMTYEKAPK